MRLFKYLYILHFKCDFSFPLPCSEDMEDPDLRGRPSRCRCVYAEHVPEGAEPQPRAARVCPLLSPSHSQQGLINAIKIQCEPEVALLISVLISAAFPVGRRQQIPFPQLSCECSSRRLRGPRRVKHLFSRPLTGTRFPSAFVPGPQIHFHSLRCRIDAVFTCDLMVGSPEPTHTHHSTKCPLEMNK